MQSFSQYTSNKLKKIFTGFASAGGPPQKDLIGNNSKKSVGFVNAGGPPENKKINENLVTLGRQSLGRQSQKPEDNIKRSRSLGYILADPEADNEGLGHPDNHHEKFIFSWHNDNMSTHPHLSNLHAHHYRTLAQLANVNHPHYKDVVRNYTEGSYELNNHLYDSYINGQKPKRTVQGIKLSQMDDLIQQHRTPHDMTVYTGPHFDPERLSEDRIVHLPAYTSTSLTPHVAKDFGVEGHVIRIHLPKGHPHLFMDNRSRYQGQSELVLPRNMQLQVDKEPSHIVTGKFKNHFEDTHWTNQDQSIHFWNAKILSKQ